MPYILKKICVGVLLGMLLNFLLPTVLQAEPGAGSEITQQCATFRVNSNYYFDDHETYDYLSGYLALHFKLKTPYNDGRTWFDRVILYKQDCTSEDFLRNDAFPAPRLSQVRAGMQYYSIRFSSLTHYDLWDDERDVKLECEGCSVDIPAKLKDGFDYGQISYAGSIDGNAGWYISSSLSIKGDPPKIKNPVLIIPGILGTELTLPDEKVWPNVSRMITEPSDNFMDTLRLDSLGRPMNISVAPGEVIDKINYILGNLHYTDLLRADLEATGYHQDKNLFLLGYDWRLSVTDLAMVLQQKIQKILQDTGASAVDVVAHSMGGLILKQYILNTKETSARVGKAIFIGVPNLGTPDAAKTLLFGDNLGLPFLNSDKIQFLAQNMASIFQMLPTREYYAQSAGFYDDLTNASSKGILNYDQSKSFLLGLGKNKKLLEDAENLHSQLDNLDFSGTNITSYNIVGCGMFTIKTINKMYYGQPSLVKQFLGTPKYRIYSDSGDGTVILPSAQYLRASAENTFFVNSVQHNQMLSADSSRKLITSLIAGTTPDFGSNISQNTNNCFLRGKLISLPNRLELNITNVQNNSALIPGLDYAQKTIGDDSYIFLPTSDSSKYKVKIKAPKDKKPVNVTSGTYTKKKSKPTTNYYDNVPIKDELTLDVSEGTLEQVKNVDDEGKESPVLPTYTEEEQVDVIAPTTKVKKFGTNVLQNSGSIYFDTNASSVFLIADDELSGVLDTVYSLDNGQNWNIADGLPISVFSDNTSVSFFSRDKAGNIEELHTVFLYYVQPPSSSYVPPVVNNEPVSETTTQPESPAPYPQEVPTEIEQNPDSATIDSAENIGDEEQTEVENTKQPSEHAQNSDIEEESFQGYPNVNVTINLRDYLPQLAETSKVVSEAQSYSNVVNFYAIQPRLFHHIYKFLLDLIFF